MESRALGESEGFGEALRRARVAAGLTQEGLAERSGSSARTIQDLERGAHQPQRDTLARLIQAIGLTGRDKAALEARAGPLPRRRRVVHTRARPVLRLDRGQTVRRPASNLPLHLTGFVGRAAELSAVTELLRRGPAPLRLVTLVGAGGCGKTRLALRVAEELQPDYPDGVWLVELAPIDDPIYIAPAIATALGIHEQPGQPILATLTQNLLAKQILLVVDNCEHLIPSCAQLVDGLLHSCPDLQILATSRQPLGIAGETTWRVPSLAVPPAATDDREPMDLAALSGDYDAIRLFVERARAVQPDFAITAQSGPHVVRICQRVDGIPLAIELAAARIRVLGVGQIADRLDDRFRLLTGGATTAPARHQTLRTSVDWSYEPLAPPERALFNRLAVFVGGFTLEAAEAVCADAPIAPTDVLDHLTSLVDRSLVHVPRFNDEARYFLLESIRQYAWEKLEQGGELTTLRTRHVEWCLALAQKANVEMNGTRAKFWLDYLERENVNVRAALEWSKASPDRIDAGLRLAVVLENFWRYRTRATEGRRHLTDLLARTSSTAIDRSRAEALKTAGWLAMWQVDLEEADRLLDESVALWRKVGDARGLAGTLWVRGAVALWRGNYERARELLEEDLAVARAVGDEHQEAGALFSLGDLARCLGNVDRAEELLQHSLAIRVAYDLDRGPAFPRFELGNVALARGNLTQATALYRQAFAAWHEIDDRSAMALAINGLSWIASAQDQADRAARLSGVAAALREASGTSVFPVHRGLDERSTTHARALLGDATYERGWAVGKAMPLAEAVAYALVEEDSPPPDLRTFG